MAIYDLAPNMDAYFDHIQECRPMSLADFRIGTEFTCGGNRWRCTDVGSRVVVAVRRPDDPRNLAGPPYSVAEVVFDEYDLPGCEPL